MLEFQSCKSINSYGVMKILEINWPNSFVTLTRLRKNYCFVSEIPWLKIVGLFMIVLDMHSRVVFVVIIIIRCVQVVVRGHASTQISVPDIVHQISWWLFRCVAALHCPWFLLLSSPASRLIYFSCCDFSNRLLFVIFSERRLSGSTSSRNISDEPKYLLLSRLSTCTVHAQAHTR